MMPDYSDVHKVAGRQQGVEQTTEESCFRDHQCCPTCGQPFYASLEQEDEYEDEELSLPLEEVEGPAISIGGHAHLLRVKDEEGNIRVLL